MDLLLNQDVFCQAGRELDKKREELDMLRCNIQKSFEQLKSDWDSDAGKQFFSRFENDLLSNLDKHVKVFEHMSQNLTTTSQKYEEVFRAADAVANVQY